MHIVKCPECGRTYKIGHEVRQKKLKCSCGASFIGSSEPEAQSRPSQPAAQAGPARYAAPAPYARAGVAGRPAAVRRKSSQPGLWIGLVSIVAIVAVAGGISLWLYNNPMVYVPDREEGGKFAFAGRVPLGQEAAKRKEINDMLDKREIEKRKALALAASKPASQPAVARGPVLGGSRKPIPGVPDGNPNITIKLKDPLTPIAGGPVYVAGTFRNVGAKPLADAEISVYVRTTKGEPRGPFKAGLRYIPVDTPVRFCIPCTDLKRDEIDSFGAICSGAGEPPRAAVCWPVTVFEKGEKESRVLSVWGDANNPTDSELGDVKVCCDFYDTSGLYMDSVVGGLDDATTISPKKAAPFLVRFEFGKSLSWDAKAEDIDKPSVRVWALKKK